MDTSKIIKGVVNPGRYTVTAPIVKEDYGLYLQIEGVELPQTYEVDFSNSEHNGTSVTMIGNSDGVLIPHQFISTGKDIFAFLYHVGEDFGRTVYKFRIPNKVRPDRTEEQPTPEEQSVINQAISALNSAVAQTAQDVIDADASAQSASQSAENAHDSAVDAQNYAESASGYASDAQGYATTASQKATAAGNSADQAAQIKTDIEGYVSTAQGYAQTATDKAAQASQSATNASNSATTASTKAGEASASATTASTKAGEASASATTASNKASEASGYASTASQKASDASDSATAAQTAQGKAEDAQTAAETAQGKAEDAQEAAETAAASIQSSAAQIAENTEDIADLQTDVAQNEADILKAFPTDSASGAIASFTDGADNIPLKSLIVNINPVQDTSSGDPSPENICPISGWEGMEIQHTKKNLLPLNIWQLPYNRSVGTVIGPVPTDRAWTQGEGKITYTTTATYTDIGLMTPLLPEGTYFYTLEKKSSGTLRCTNYILDKSYKVKQMTNSSNVASRYRITRTLDEEGYIAIKLDNGTTASQTVEIEVQISYGDTEQTYEPYNGTTLPISWQTEAGTVYGGKLDVLTGKLTVYPYYASYNGETLTGEWISDRDKYVSGTTPTIGAQVVNIGAQGVTVQLEPHEVNSLLGVNNIWADSGDTTAEYRADTKLFIERLTAPDSADMVADANITSGQYFMVGNSLYKATANIANSSAIVVGTNCIRKSLSEALNEINA